MPAIKLLAVAITVACTASAVAIPTPSGTFNHDLDAPDGLYIHVVDSNGNPQNIHLGEVRATAPRAEITGDSLFIARRDGQGAIHCNNQYELDYDDLVGAEQDFEQKYGTGNWISGTPVSVKHGKAVAFMCDYGSVQKFTASWLAAQFANLAQQCGASAPGWINFPDWKASYGVDKVGASFC